MKMVRLIDSLKRRSRWFFGTTALAIVLVVGAVDYFTGFEISFAVFYLLAVALAVWFVDTRFGMAISILSVITSLVGDSAAGAHYAHPFVPVWNAMITLTFYFVAIWLLASLRSLHRDLEERVRQRTSALTEEMAERERLEKELLNVSEREQQRIGHDLHDSLCQQLTAAALAGKVLADQLADQPAPAAAAQRVVTIVGDSINLARSLAHGLAPVELEAAGLMQAFEELVDTITEQFRVECRFVCEVPLLIPEAATATHLYRIAQEAISNAIKHGQAKHIAVHLAQTEAGTMLEVTDDGVGLPDPLPAGRGMGLRIMAHRATMIGGTFAVCRSVAGGTVVTCIVP